MNTRAKKMQTIGYCLHQLKAAREQGFVPIPSRFEERDQDYLRVDAHVNGMTCQKVRCEKCGHEYRLRSFEWMIKHRKQCS